MIWFLSWHYTFYFYYMYQSSYCPQTNCLALVMFDDALRRAAELDEYLDRTGRTVGRLHGLPISVKEHIELKGTPATAGFIAWADLISEDDSLIVKILREAGAVFHVKTTNPQALMVVTAISQALLHVKKNIY